jgi:nitrous oxidase accessory protein
MIRFSLCFLLILAAFEAFSYENTLQKAIDGARDGSVILLDKGIYRGNIVIDKSLTIDGKDNGAVIMGDGTGSVITLKAGHSTLKNLTVMASGEMHDSIDSCISVSGVNVVKILNNNLNDCLFGINLEQVNRSLIEGNNISSKPFSLGLKGDGIRLWYSHSNIIRSNRAGGVRDIVFWYSSANRIERNHITNSRYALHFMYADRNTVTGNSFDSNSVGAFFMFSHSSRVLDNIFRNASGSFGIGMGFKECSDFLLSGNTVLYNARGVYIDQSPYQPGTVNTYTNNSLLHNTVGIQFHGTTIGSRFEGNTFRGNITDISNDTPESALWLNSWFMNKWDNYEGFDFDGDGFGDNPMTVSEYADRIMHYKPSVKFFYGSPAMSLLDFLSRLLPFSEPEVLAVDEKPSMGKL